LEDWGYCGIRPQQKRRDGRAKTSRQETSKGRESIKQEFPSSANAERQHWLRKLWCSRERSPAHKRRAPNPELRNRLGVQILNAFHLPSRTWQRPCSILPLLPLMRPHLKQPEGLRKKESQHHANAENHRRD